MGLLRALLRAVLCLAFARSAALCGAPPPLSTLQVRVWSQSQGLPGTLNALARTPDGYLWIGTYEGLYRFDGVRFTAFTAENTPAFENSRIRSLLADSDGGLWIGLAGHLAHLGPEGFRRIPIPEYRPHDSVHAILRDRTGALWVLSGMGGLLRYDGRAFTRVGTPRQVLGGSQARMALAPDGSVVVASPEGLLTPSGTGLVPFSGSPLPRGTAALSAASDPNGTLWVSTPEALYRLTTHGIQRFTAKEGLPFTPLNILMPDGQGGLWFCTPNGGIARFDGQHFEIPANIAGRQGNLAGLLSDPEGSTWIASVQHGLLQLSAAPWITRGPSEGYPERVNALLRTRDGALWMGTNGQGLWRSDGGLPTQFGPKEGFRDYSALSLAESPDGVLWIGTYTSLYRLQGGRPVRVTTPFTQSMTAIRGIFFDSRGRQWIAVDGQGVEVWDHGTRRAFGPATGQPMRIPFGFAESPPGVVWVSSLDGYLMRIEGEQVQVLGPESGIPAAYTLLPIPGGGLWMGTPTGLACFRDGRCRQFRPEEGFPSESFLNLTYDESGNLVARCQVGIRVYPRQPMEAFLAGQTHRVAPVEYGPLEGISSTSGPAQPGSALTPDRVLMLGSMRGLVVRPPQAPPVNSVLPIVLVESILADGRPQAPGGSLRWEGGNLEVDYTATSMLNPDKVRFRYRLEGFDPDWVDAGTRRKAYYTHVPPGPYTFRVKACNDAGLWNEEGAQMTFRLRPRWYQAWWFRGLWVAALGVAIWLGVRWRIRELRAAKARLEATVVERTRDLQATAVDLATKNLELEEFDRIVKALNRELGLEPLLQVLLQQITTQFPMAQRGMVLLRDATGACYRTACLQGYAPGDEDLARQFQVPEAEVRDWYARTRDQVQGGIHLVRSFQGLPGADRMRLVPPKCMLLMPLEMEDQLEGFLTLQNLEDPEAFAAADGAKLMRFREHLLSALTKARILEELAARERELRRSEERYALVVEGANEGIWDLDLVRGDFYCSDRLGELLGVPAESLNAVTWESRIHPDDRPQVRAALRGHLRDHAPYDVEFRMRTGSGEERWFRSRGQATWGADGRATRMGGSLGDITGRKAAERLLQAAKEAAEQARADLEVRNRELEELEAAVKALNRELDLGSLLRVFMAQIATQFPASQRSIFLLRDPQQAAYRVAGLQGYPAEDAAAMGTLVIPESEMHPWYARAHADGAGEILLVRDVPALPGAARSPLALPRAVLILPLEVDGQPEGFLALQNLEDAEAFAEADRAKLLRYREHLRSAVLKARTVQRLDAMVRDLAEANQVAESARHIAEFEREDARAARREAEEASQAKSAFLANMSHEIRTPLNAIQGFSLLGLKLDLDPRPRDYFQKIVTASRTLLGLINDILDFSKIEAGKLELESVPFTLATVVANVADLFGQAATEKGLELLLDLEPGLPSRMVGDPLRLGQVLTNLLGNAIKFTEQGHVILGIRAAGGAGDKLFLDFSVEDSGIGMTADQAGRLFQAFSQADASTTRKFGGTGLGLVISRRLVRLMGGEIQVESQPGRGSRFAFTIPLGRVMETPMEALPNDLRVLVVDDHPTSRIVLENQLHHLGCRTSTAESGEQALDLLRREAFDVVLMDWRMPGWDGLETTRRLHAFPGLAAMPTVIMVTAHAREGMWPKAQELGIRTCLLKPVHPDLLRHALAEAMGWEAPAPLDGLAPRGEDAESLEGLRVLVVEDHPTNQEVIREMLRRWQVEPRMASSGPEALRILESESVDLVLMDVQMPGMDGFETTQRIRHQPRHAALPIVALTANAMAQDRQACLEAGMNDFLSKPVEPEALLRVLRLWSGRTAPEAAPPALVPPPPALAVWDRAGALRRMGGNEALLARLVASFRQDYATGAAELDRLAADEPSAAEAWAHTLRGVAGNLGAGRLGAAAGALEAAFRQGQPPPAEEFQAALDATLRAFAASAEGSPQ